MHVWSAKAINASLRGIESTTCVLFFVSSCLEDVHCTLSNQLISLFPNTLKLYVVFYCTKRALHLNQFSIRFYN